MSLCFCFQVIRNLVSNAIKFSPQGGEVIINVYFEPKPLMKGKRHSVSSVVKKEGKAAKSAAVSAAGSSVRGLSRIFSDHILSQFSPDGGSVATPPHPNSPPSIFGRLVVSVTDNGPGISAENQKRLFKEVIQVSHPPNTPPSATSYTLSSQPLFHPPLSLFSTSLSPSPISFFNLSFTLLYLFFQPLFHPPLSLSSTSLSPSPTHSPLSHFSTTIYSVQSGETSGWWWEWIWVVHIQIDRGFARRHHRGVQVSHLLLVSPPLLPFLY